VPETLKTGAGISKVAIAAVAELIGVVPVRLGSSTYTGMADHRGLSAASINVTLAAIRFLYEVTLGRADVMATVCRMKVVRKLPSVLSVTEVERLLSVIARKKDRAMVMVAYGAGLRASEVCRLEVCDIDAKRMLLHVRDGKGGRDRYTLLSPLLLKTLRAYAKESAIRGPKVFPPRNPDQSLALTRSSFHKMVRSTGRRAGITKRVFPHTLRHAFATHLLESGVDLPADSRRASRHVHRGAERTLERVDHRRDRVRDTLNLMAEGWPHLLKLSKIALGGGRLRDRLAPQRSHRLRKLVAVEPGSMDLARVERNPPQPGLGHVLRALRASERRSVVEDHALRDSRHLGGKLLRRARARRERTLRLLAGDPHPAAATAGLDPEPSSLSCKQLQQAPRALVERLPRGEVRRDLESGRLRVTVARHRPPLYHDEIRTSLPPGASRARADARRGGRAR
jgi:integrase